MSLKSSRVNWHEAASCAFQIELQDYSDLLEYITEYILGKNSYRIDLLIIKKLTDKIIPKNIARILKLSTCLKLKESAHLSVLMHTIRLLDMPGYWSTRQVNSTSIPASM